LLQRYSLVIIMILATLACGQATEVVRPLPTATFQQVRFEVQTPTSTVATFPTLPPTNTPTITPIPPTATPTMVITATAIVTESTEIDEPVVEPTDTPQPVVEVEPTSTPEPVAIETLEPLRGGEWDFEAGFSQWINPHGDACAEGALAIGWQAFTERDQFGSSCMNKTEFAANVYIGQFAQEITYAFVGVQSGIYRTVPTIPGHQFTVEAYVKREFSPSKTEVALGIDLTGGSDWQAETVQWFPWKETAQDSWTRTEEKVIATGDSMTIFIKGHHPLPEGGGALRIDTVSVVDNGIPQ